jgi:hypothetical protein
MRRANRMVLMQALRQGPIEPRRHHAATRRCVGDERSA